MIILELLFLWFVVSLVVSLVIGKLLARNSYEEPVTIDEVYMSQHQNQYSESVA